jgi:hypothetical protein
MLWLEPLVEVETDAGTGRYSRSPGDVGLVAAGLFEAATALRLGSPTTCRG